MDNHTSAGLQSLCCHLWPLLWTRVYVVSCSNQFEKYKMALSLDQAMQMLDFSSGKLNVQLLDSVVCRFYDGNGPEVNKYTCIVRHLGEGGDLKPCWYIVIIMPAQERGVNPRHYCIEIVGVISTKSCLQFWAHWCLVLKQCAVTGMLVVSCIHVHSSRMSRK